MCDKSHRFRKEGRKKRRKTVACIADVKAEPDGWHELKIRMIGNRIACHLQGVKLVEVKDDNMPALQGGIVDKGRRLTGA